MATKRTLKEQQRNAGKGDTQNRRPVIVRNLRSAKRLFSRLLRDIQTGEVDNGTGRLLVYALSEFVRMLQGADFEQRLERLEQQLGGSNDVQRAA